MDIEYLLLLQDFRNAVNDALTPFMEMISLFAGDAVTTATGYSFPGGHTTTATPIYGGSSESAWKKHKS